MKNKVTVELKKGTLRWFYHIKAANGEILSTSQKYFSRSNALRAAKKTAERLGTNVKVLKK